MPRVASGSKATVAKKKPAAKRAPAGGHKLAPPLPAGIILQDTMKKKWKLGKGVGQGGFGQLYLASDDVEKTVPSSAPFVIKIEPHANGPLFSELHFYQRAAKSEAIDKWKSEHRLKHLGVPKYIGSGLHEEATVKYRFMVMERFGEDLGKIFERNEKKFMEHSIYMLAIRILDVFEYIHAKEYTHADVKGSNLLLGYNNKQVYLVDYGLAYRYSPEGVHKPFKEDPKKAHDGTIEFTSIDAHKGATPSRRSDLEILGYVLLQWLCSVLPWEDKLNDKNYVRAQKIKYMSDIPALMEKCLPGRKNSVMSRYLKYTQELSYEETPDYVKLRQMFSAELKRLGVSDSAKLDLSAPTGSITTTIGTKRRSRSSTVSPSDAGSSSSPVVKKPRTAVRGEKGVGGSARPTRRKTTPSPATAPPSSSSSDERNIRSNKRTSANNNSTGTKRAVTRSSPHTQPSPNRRTVSPIQQRSSVATQTSPWLRKAYLKEGHKIMPK